jgi:hypothetical protein
MVQHWISTPVNGYLGSGYGSDMHSLLQTPMAAGLADGLLAKCRQDVPLLLMAAPDAVSVYAEDIGMDAKRIVFEIGGELIPVDREISALPNDDGTAADLELSLIDTLNQTGAEILHAHVHVTMPTDDYF